MGPLLSVLVFSQILLAGQSCPVDVIKAGRYSDGGEQPCVVHCGHVIDVAYRNVSDKAIAVVSLGVDMYSDVKTRRALFFDLRDRDGMEPGETREGSWSEVLYHRDYPQVNVFVKKVVFADNTQWKDDGSGSCSSGIPGLVAKGAARAESDANALVAKQDIEKRADD